jgi:outer membrane protein OmpA-like peptidoglycan-associated protein
MAASFTDLMASLMVIFVLLFVATVNNASASRERVQGDLLKTLRAQLAAQGLDTMAIKRDERDPYAIVIVMPDSLLFERDSSRVREGGQRYLSGVTPILANILCSRQMVDHIDNVVIEGHTDTTYAGTQLTADYGRGYNMRLSQARSMEVVGTSLRALGDRPEADRSCFRRMLSASGRGQEEPLGAIPGNDPRQRRVVFKIRVKADMVKQLTRQVPGRSAAVVTSP